MGRRQPLPCYLPLHLQADERQRPPDQQTGLPQRRLLPQERLPQGLQLRRGQDDQSVAGVGATRRDTNAKGDGSVLTTITNRLRMTLIGERGYLIRYWSHANRWRRA